LRFLPITKKKKNEKRKKKKKEKKRKIVEEKNSWVSGRDMLSFSVLKSRKIVHFHNTGLFNFSGKQLGMLIRKLSVFKLMSLHWGRI